MEIIFVTGIHPSTVFFLLDLFWLFILGILERLTIQARPYLLCSFIWLGLAVNLQNQLTHHTETEEIFYLLFGDILEIFAMSPGPQ